MCKITHHGKPSDGCVGPDVIQSDSDGDQAIKYPDSAVAVIGLACKFAGANSVEELWRILETGTSQCADLPKDRFPDFRFERRQWKRDFKANVMDGVDLFDHKFFNISSREAAFMDPQQRLALQLTYQALESAGYFARENSDTQQDMGCFFATTMAEYYENVATHAPSALSLTGSLRPFIAGKVSHHFGFTGPAIMLDAACAASGAAINVACRAVASGECKSAVVGATNVFVSPDTFQDLACGHFTSPTGQSRSFDAAADGYARGEGVAVLVLKKLSDAIKDGDVVKGVISATAVNQCGNGNSITVPDGSSQSSLYRKALRLAGLDASDISYVEAHGTGTRVGDPIEADSIRAVFGDCFRKRKTMTYMGSLKSNIGHVEASAGLSGLIKAILMIEKGIIPQQALFESLNPDIAPLGTHNIEIPTSNVPWPAKQKAVCVNNYGASGTNAVAIVTQSPGGFEEDVETRPTVFPVSITAFSPSSLRSYCAAMLQFIQQSETTNISMVDVAYHLSRRRNPDLPYSVTSSVTTIQELKDFLASAQLEEPRKLDRGKHPVVLFFGGQTGKTASVSRGLYDLCAIFRKHLDACDATLQALGGTSIYPAIFKPESLDSSVLAHTTLFSGQYANALAWIECGIKPAKLIGHSFGQLTALCVAGVLSLHDALRLVIHRAHLIEKAWGNDPGSMIAIEISQGELSELLTRHAGLNLEIACCNGARSFVLAGTTTSVDSLEASMRTSMVVYRYKRLQVPNAFHSALAQPLLDPLQQVAEELHFQEPKFSLETCSNDTTWPSVTPSRIALHIREPVYFYQAVTRISEQLGSCTWIDTGSGSSLSMLHRALEPQASSHDTISFRTDSSASLVSLAEATAKLWRVGLKVQFWPFHQYQRHHYRALNLPPYQFDKSRHWLEWKELSAPAIKDHQSPVQSQLLRLLRKDKDEGDFEVNTQSQEWRTACHENRILGLPTCPVSLLLDIVSTAVDAVQTASAHKESVYDVRHLSMPVPIAGNLGKRLHLRLDRADLPHSWDFKLTVMSDRNSKLASGILSARNKVLYPIPNGFARSERLLDPARIRNIATDRDSDSVKGRGVYTSLTPSFEIPKCSQAIREVAAKDEEAIASLVLLPEKSLDSVESLLQVPLVCLNALHERQHDEILINTVIGEAQFRDWSTCSSNADALWSVYLKFFNRESSEAACDMYLFDANSQRLFATLFDVVFSRVHATSLRQDIDGTSTGCPITLSETPDLASIEAPLMQIKEISLGDHVEFASPNTSHDITQTLFDLLARVADVETDGLRGNALIGDLGIDSLMGIEVADEINREFSVDIDITEFLDLTDVDSLCQLIASRATGFSYSSTLSLGGSSHQSGDFSDTVSSSATGISSAREELGKRCLSPTASGSFYPLLNAASKAFNDIREEFDFFARETGCDRFWSDIYPLQTGLIIAYIIEAFAKLGCDFRSLNAGERVLSVHHLPKHSQLLERLMFVLRDESLIYQSGDDWIRSRKALPALQPSSKLFEQIQARFPQFAPEHELLHVAGSKLAECFDGTQNPLKLLFGSPERRKLMADQYLIAPIQASVSRQLASFIKRCFGSQPFEHPLRILEVGGGTCGTSLYALKAFAELGIPIEYTFTDISSSFITAAKSKLERFDCVKYRTLDITKHPPADLMGRYDMAIATNVIHATPNACLSAANVRQMLRPGGFLTLAEYTNLYPAGDVIFGQLDGWWAFEDGRKHALMNENEWRVTLERAGYSKVDWTGSHTRESSIFKIFLAY